MCFGGWWQNRVDVILCIYILLDYEKRLSASMPWNKHTPDQKWKHSGDFVSSRRILGY